MKKLTLTQKTIDVLQWILVIGLSIVVILEGICYSRTQKQLIASEEYNRQNTYIRIYESQKLNKLKNENRELYDSISKLQNVESAMIIKFKERYHTDTITVDRFVVQKDTVYDNNDLTVVDSIYHYEEDNDTVKCKIDIKAKELEWCNTDVEINDKFVIINRELNGVNQTSIAHNGTAVIGETGMWHKQDKVKWYKRFSVGPQVGVGYGVINNKFDCYVGVGVGYNFLK